MANRKKRAQKGLATLQDQKETHLRKREEAYKEGRQEVVHYFDKELENMEQQITEKKRILKGK